MAAYGRGQMLGLGIDPRLMAVDYSPFVDAAATTARSNVALASSIGGTIEKGVNQFTDYKKQQAEDERLIQKSKSVAKAIGDLIPDLQPTIQESMMILDDKEVPLSRRKAEAEAISDILNLGINEVRNRQEVGMRQKELGIREAANIAEMTQLDRDYQNKASQRQAKTVKVGEFDVAVVEDGFGNIYDPVTDRPITNLAAFALNRDDFGPVDLPQDGMVLPPREFPDGVPTNGVPVSPADFDYNQIPMLSEDRLVAPETVQAIEAAGTPRVVPRTGAQALTPTFRAATPEEAALYGAATGQIDESTGRFYPAPQTQGRTTRVNPRTGEVEIIEGTGSGASKEERQAQAKGIAERRSFDSILGSSVQSLDKIDRVLAENPVLAAGQGILSKALPATDSGELSLMFENMRNETSKATLFELKEITGAVGQTTEKEWPRYESRFGKIEVGMKPEQIKNNIKLNTLNAFEAVNGSPDKMLKLLEEGKATQEQFDSYVDSYKAIRNELGIPNQGVLGYKTDWSKFEDKLVDKYTGRNPSISRERPSTGLTPEEMELLNKY
jgi:hypothetical protein